MSRAERLKDLLSTTRRTTNQAQSSFIKAEDLLSTLEEREAARSARAQGRREAMLRRRS